MVTSGWTLQELLTRAKQVFFDYDWITIGMRESPSGAILSATGIQDNDFKDIKRVSVAKWMSWASKRETIRREDMAYCSLGLFDVNMPLLYGEGSEKAFLRLQLQILQDSDDESIFAWMRDGAPSSLLVQSSADFAPSYSVIALRIVDASTLREDFRPFA
jgi:hypothetical protein